MKYGTRKFKKANVFEDTKFGSICMRCGQEVTKCSKCPTSFFQKDLIYCNRKEHKCKSCFKDKGKR